MKWEFVENGWSEQGYPLPLYIRCSSCGGVTESFNEAMLMWKYCPYCKEEVETDEQTAKM